MKKPIIPLTIAILTSGCATIGNYREIDDGGYLISAQGNMFSSYEDKQKKLKDKSQQACNGSYKIREVLPVDAQIVRTYGDYPTKTTVLVYRQIIDCL